MSRALQALKLRGLLADTTHKAIGPALDEAMKKSATSKLPLSVYCGFDPTASSLHVGNLIQLIALRHFQLAGVRPIVLLGGATGMIGDPSGKSEDRVLLQEETISNNLDGIRKNLNSILDFDCPNVGAKLCNNSEWYSSMPAVDWLRDVGSFFRVNAMLSKESVKRRLDSDQGISFLEFSYSLFQAYDFLHLSRSENCMLQIGGSDQWGNITSGCELIRKVSGQDAFGVTIPLLTTSTGDKYGKSAGNAIWLDGDKTSYYQFYQYFLRSEDADVDQLLKTFTFMSEEEIKDIVAKHASAPEARVAQKELAARVTKLIHGEEGLHKAQQVSSVLFGGSLDGLRAEDVLSIASDAPSITLPANQVFNNSVTEVAVQAGATKSKGETRRLVKAGGLYLNNTRIASDRAVEASDVIDNQVLLLRTGKKNYVVVKVDHS